MVVGEEHCAWLQVSTTPGPKDPVFEMSDEYKVEALLGKVIERHHRRFVAWLRYEQSTSGSVSKDTKESDGGCIIPPTSASALFLL